MARVCACCWLAGYSLLLEPWRVQWIAICLQRKSDFSNAFAARGWDGKSWNCGTRKDCRKEKTKRIWMNGYGMEWMSMHRSHNIKSWMNARACGTNCICGVIAYFTFECAWHCANVIVYAEQHAWRASDYWNQCATDICHMAHSRRRTRFSTHSIRNRNWLIFVVSSSNSIALLNAAMQSVKWSGLTLNTHIVIICVMNTKWFGVLETESAPKRQIHNKCERNYLIT